MKNDYYESTSTSDFMKTKRVKSHSPWVHLALFLITLITTIIAGAEWTTGYTGMIEFTDVFKNGLPYALSILFFLSCHEFGHYFAARYHGIDVTLPYYIPFPPIPLFLNFGTMGAVIRTKSVIPNNKIMFDIGVAGPIAGFIATIGILAYGFINLPPVDYILTIHPDYFTPEYGEGALSLEFGTSILFSLFQNIFAPENSFIPPMSEIYHYPYLCVGWFGLFVTMMNLIPVGQLDGGHIIYGMFGEKRHEAIASISMVILIALGVLGILDSFLELNFGLGWSGWLFWSLILYFFIKVKHPPVPQFQEISVERKILGYISLAILLLSFSPAPFVLSLPAGM
jgi:membrane-associated protease RseP (regulator of RpoE activity)